MHYRKFETDAIRQHHYSNTLNEYGGELLRHITDSSFQSSKSTIKHFAQVALIQTMKMSIELGKLDSSKLDIAVKIYNFGISNFSDAFKHQIEPLKERLLKISPDKTKDLICPPQNMSREIWTNFMKAHSLGDVVEGTVIRVIDTSVDVIVENMVYGTFWLLDDASTKYSKGQKVSLEIYYYSDRSRKLGLRLHIKGD